MWAVAGATIGVWLPVARGTSSAQSIEQSAVRARPDACRKRASTASSDATTIGSADVVRPDVLDAVRDNASESANQVPSLVVPKSNIFLNFRASDFPMIGEIVLLAYSLDLVPLPPPKYALPDTPYPPKHTF